jgi:predicted RecB family nuclease
MADLMRLPGIDGQYAEIMQAVGVSSVKELGKFEANTLHEKMLKYNKTNSIVPEVPSVELLSTWAISSDSNYGSTTSSSDAKTSSKDNTVSNTNTGTSTTSGHLNECYEIEEVEGIGPGYGKRFRKLGINTTCDLANTYLRDNKAIKKASKKMGVDFDAIKAWASMADLMRLPGVDGQYAEIMQTVGLDSRKELTHISLNHLHELMVEFNAKNPIVPEVPTMDMLVAWSSAAKKQK